MTRRYESRLRRLETTIRKPTGGHIALFIEGHPDPSPEVIEQAVSTLHVTFIRPTRDEAGADVRH